MLNGPFFKNPLKSEFYKTYCLWIVNVNIVCVHYKYRYWCLCWYWGNYVQKHRFVIICCFSYSLVSCSHMFTSQRCSKSSKSLGLCFDFGGSPTCYPSDALSTLRSHGGVFVSPAAETTAAIAPGTRAGLTTGGGPVELIGLFEGVGNQQAKKEKTWVMSSWERGGGWDVFQKNQSMDV